MKLRIKGNSLRMRVGRAELTRFLHDGRIEDTIHFAAEPEASLTYALEVSVVDTAQTQVRYLPRKLRCSYPRPGAPMEPGWGSWRLYKGASWRGEHARSSY